MDFKLFEKLSKNYTAVPVYRRLLADTMTPVSLYLNIRKDAHHPFLFESVEGGEQLARYSFLGCNPYQVLSFDGEKVILTDSSGNKTHLEQSYFEALNELTSEHSEPDIPGLPRLSGGAVGFSSYDTFREVEHLPDVPEDDLNLPEAMWGFYDEIYAFDHVKHQIVLIKTVFTKRKHIRNIYEDAQAALDRMEAAAKASKLNTNDFDISSDDVVSNMDYNYFKSIVEKAKNYIFEGDIFQVVLSQRFETSLRGDRFMLYRALRMVNPSPYLFYLDFDEFCLVGSSPEVLVRVQDREVRLLPIAGTRPRGKTHEEDLKLEEDLMSDPKELAEHIMLVDLGRNDLSRVCEAGTVKLQRKQVVERYSHVMHIVSDVVGELADEFTAVDALMYCFPAGTVSGAPKIRAMQIIDQLEPTKRGIYAGAVGYFDFSGNMDTCIAIRTMVAKKNTVYIQAGAGIVADSDPKKEFNETKDKASALIEALSIALDIT